MDAVKRNLFNYSIRFLGSSEVVLRIYLVRLLKSHKKALKYQLDAMSLLLVPANNERASHVEMLHSSCSVHRLDSFSRSHKNVQFMSAIFLVISIMKSHNSFAFCSSAKLDCLFFSFGWNHVRVGGMEVTVFMLFLSLGRRNMMMVHGLRIEFYKLDVHLLNVAGSTCVWVHCMISSSSFQTHFG